MTPHFDVQRLRDGITSPCSTVKPHYTMSSDICAKSQRRQPDNSYVRQEASSRPFAPSPPSRQPRCQLQRKVIQEAQPGIFKGLIKPSACQPVRQ